MAEAGAGGQGHGLFGTDGAFYAEAVTGSSFRHSSVRMKRTYAL